MTRNTDHVTHGTRDGHSQGRPWSRRQLLAAAGGTSAFALAGCQGLTGGDGGGSAPGQSLSQFRGSGPLVESREPPGGTSIADLPDLEGSPNVYLGGGEGGLYLDLFDLFTDLYPDFDYRRRIDASASLANTVVEEVDAGSSPADVFIAVDAGSLAAVAEAGAAESLSSGVTGAVDDDFATERWVGVAGRARAVPYNTAELSAEDIPDSVQDFPQASALAGSVGWAPTYSAFQSFVTAMRLLRGDDGARQWLTAMREAGATAHPNEFRVSDTVASGDLRAGFANHYYALRVRNARPDAPVDLAFTSGDAASLINVSGGLAVQGTDRLDLVENLLRHLTSAEAQEFFATRTFAYPTVPEVAPAGGLPSIDDLNPPDIDLTELRDQDATLDLLRETDVL